jgi:hypothetical protein
MISGYPKTRSMIACSCPRFASIIHH